MLDSRDVASEKMRQSEKKLVPIIKNGGGQTSKRTEKESGPILNSGGKNTLLKLEPSPTGSCMVWKDASI